MIEWIKAGFMLRLGSFLYDLVILLSILSTIGFLFFVLLVIDKIQQALKEEIMTDKEWEAFGYPTKEPCRICGKTEDCKSEPRFGYATCREHAKIAPTSK